MLPAGSVYRHWQATSNVAWADCNGAGDFGGVCTSVSQCMQNQSSSRSLQSACKIGLVACCQLGEHKDVNRFASAVNSHDVAENGKQLPGYCRSAEMTSVTCIPVHEIVDPSYLSSLCSSKVTIRSSGKSIYTTARSNTLIPSLLKSNRIQFTDIHRSHYFPATAIASCNALPETGCVEDGDSHKLVMYHSSNMPPNTCSVSATFSAQIMFHPPVAFVCQPHAFSSYPVIVTGLPAVSTRSSGPSSTTMPDQVLDLSRGKTVFTAMHAGDFITPIQRHVLTKSTLSERASNDFVKSTYGSSSPYSLQEFRSVSSRSVNGTQVCVSPLMMCSTNYRPKSDVLLPFYNATVCDGFVSHSSCLLFSIGCSISSDHSWCNIYSATSHVNGDQRFLPSNVDQRFLPSNGDQRFLPSNGDQRFLLSNVDQRFLPSNVDQRFLPSNVDQRFLPSNVDQRFLPSNVDQRFLLSNVDQRFLPYNVDQRFLPSNVDQRFLPSNVDQRFLPSNVDQLFLPSNVDQRFLPSNVDHCASLASKNFSLMIQDGNSLNNLSTVSLTTHCMLVRRNAYQSRSAETLKVCEGNVDMDVPHQTALWQTVFHCSTECCCSVASVSGKSDYAISPFIDHCDGANDCDSDPAMASPAASVFDYHLHSQALVSACCVSSSPHIETFSNPVDQHFFTRDTDPGFVKRTLSDRSPLPIYENMDCETNSLLNPLNSCCDNENVCLHWEGTAIFGPDGNKTCNHTTACESISGKPFGCAFIFYIIRFLSFS